MNKDIEEFKELMKYSKGLTVLWYIYSIYGVCVVCMLLVAIMMGV